MSCTANNRSNRQNLGVYWEWEIGKVHQVPGLPFPLLHPGCPVNMQSSGCPLGVYHGGISNGAIMSLRAQFYPIFQYCLVQPQCIPEERKHMFPYHEDASITAPSLQDAANTPLARHIGKTTYAVTLLIAYDLVLTPHKEYVMSIWPALAIIKWLEYTS